MGNCKNFPLQVFVMLIEMYNLHSEIVDVLLTAGFPVSLHTRSGTALHEAAIGGKVSVVRRLLDASIDVLCQDSRGQTAQQILEDLETPVAKDITAMIRDRVYQSVQTRSSPFTR